MTFADDIYVKVVDLNGDDYAYDGQDIAQIPYADGTVMGVFQDSGAHAGYYKFSLGADIISEKPVTFTMGPSGDLIGTLRPDAFETHVYTLQMGAAGVMSTMSLKSGRALSSPEVSETPNTVSKYEYDKLVSRLNSLEAKLKNVVGDN